MTIIAIDAMGGDVGPSITVPAAVEVLASNAGLHLILVGDEAVLQQALKPFTYDAKRLTIQHASQRVEMDEPPSQALRNKKDSSMRVAIDLVKEAKAHACVSAGNTGALMATARFVLKMIPGIDRPAIISSFPTAIKNKSVRMLDLGANVDSTPENLAQFAVMGSVLASGTDHIKNPKVFLLNIGAEEIKGNELVKQAAQLLSNLDTINYQGYIEADAIFEGVADVVVCDGFVGNITLKTTEGVVHFIRTLMKEAFMRNWLTKILGLMVKPVLKTLSQRLDPTRYNGATLIGLKGTVIKSHGGASKDAFAQAIREAVIQVETNIVDQLLTFNMKQTTL